MIYKVIKESSKKTDNNQESSYFTSIQEAIDVALAGDVIHITEGVYREKIQIRTSGLTIRGQSSETSIIEYDDYALKKHEDGENYGTFRSYTCLIDADDVVLENVTIENKAGDGRSMGQAIALYAQGDRLQFSQCRFIAYQDTLFAGPLPPSPKIPKSFKGPTENNIYKTCRQYYEACQIIGDVDYIFGSALAVFNRCKLVTRNRNELVNGYITAPSTWQHEAYGFVFINSEFCGEPGIEKETVYLGRPWRPYGHVKFIGCKYDPSIHPDRWDVWGDEANRKTAQFHEYRSLIDMEFLDVWHRERIGKLGENNGI